MRSTLSANYDNLPLSHSTSMVLSHHAHVRQSGPLLRFPLQQISIEMSHTVSNAPGEKDVSLVDAGDASAFSGVGQIWSGLWKMEQSLGVWSKQNLSGER